MVRELSRPIARRRLTRFRWVEDGRSVVAAGADSLLPPFTSIPEVAELGSACEVAKPDRWLAGLCEYASRRDAARMEPPDLVLTYGRVFQPINVVGPRHGLAALPGVTWVSLKSGTSATPRSTSY